MQTPSFILTQFVYEPSTLRQAIISDVEYMDNVEDFLAANENERDIRAMLDNAGSLD